MATMENVLIEKIAEKIHLACTKPRSLLFCGAGVGIRVGMPSWKSFILHLADVCERHGERTAAALIRERVDGGDFLGAATVYKTAKRIPSGERLKELSALFRHTPPEADLEKLKPLLQLPVSAIVTTNYERSLHDAYALARKSTAIPIEIDDKTLTNGAIRTDFFVARIHGRAEKPETMIVDDQDYASLSGRPEYLDFLLGVLTQRPCVFLGFSFSDPAIAQVISIYKEKVGPNFPSLHLAVLPQSAANSLGHSLASVNIEVVCYDEDEDHKNLWRAIRLSSEGGTAGTPRPQVASRSSFHRLLAFTYAQAKSRAHQTPVLELATDGMVGSVIAAAGKKGIDEDILAAHVRSCLHLDLEQAREVLTNSVIRLLRDGEVEKRGRILTVAGESEPSVLEEHIAYLSRAVLDRMTVREGIKVGKNDESAAAEVLEALFITRAWDLAAHYAGASCGYAADLPLVIRELVNDQAKKGIISRPFGMEQAIADLIRAPDVKEASILAELGRSAFALQIVLSSPRQALFQKFSLPQRVYFDTNVLLPAVTEGHPLRPAYADTIARLRSASTKVGSPCELCIGNQFLEEILAHRQIAIDLVRQLNLNERTALQKHISLYGATNTNIFIGAYSSHVGRKGRKISFDQFLQNGAPYTTEAQLTSFLRKQGFTVVNMNFRDRHNPEFNTIFSHLLEDNKRPRHSIHSKEKILVQHEAQQLAQLQVDENAKLRTIFVSADQQLQRILQKDQRLHSLSSKILSQLGFMGLIDIMVGLDADKRSFVRIVWGTPRSESKQLIRDYLIKRALEEYDTGLTMAMPDVVDRVAEEAAVIAKQRGIEIASASEPQDIARTADFMDRMEEKFFASMREVMEKKNLS